MDADSFKSLVLPCVDRMYRTAICLTGNEADAADAVQEACLKLWENRCKLDDVANIQAYAARAVRNACYDAFAARKPADDIDNAYGIMADCDTEHQFEIAESLRNVERIIAKLPQNQRTVITMRDIDGCSIDEIAQATGYSGGNIKVLLCRARASIRKYFQL